MLNFEKFANCKIPIDIPEIIEITVKRKVYNLEYI